jgi:hypothetical protein
MSPQPFAEHHSLGDLRSSIILGIVDRYNFVPINLLMVPPTFVPSCIRPFCGRIHLYVLHSRSILGDTEQSEI